MQDDIKEKIVELLKELKADEEEADPNKWFLDRLKKEDENIEEININEGIAKREAEALKEKEDWNKGAWKAKQE